MRHSIFARSSAFFIAAAALVGLSSFAAAQDCNTDADCGEGFHCESYGETCSFAPGQEEPECDAPDGGYCVRTPVTCDTDADCGYAWLGCQASYGGDEPPSVGTDNGADEAFCPEEECGAPEPTEPGPSYCAPKEITCEADSDCPADFECTVYATSGGGSDCAAPACPEGEECEVDFSCEEREPAPVEEYRACAPREITCNADNDCPSDWTCLTESYGYCTGSGGAAPEPGDDFAPDQDREAPEDNCFEETISRCIPAGYDYYSYAYDTAGSGNGEATGEPREDSNVFGDDGSDDSEAGTGCSATGMTPTTGLLPMLLLGLGLVALRRR